MALSVKRALVDRNLLNVTHEAFQKLLFLHLAEHNLGAATIRRFLLVARFFALRTPFVLLLGGPPCCLKSTLAQALAAALNMPNVQQTDVAFSLLRRNRMQLPKLWRRGCANEAEVLHWYRQEAALVRRAIDADLRKARQSGKPLIVEGLHVDPGLFLVELGVLPAIQARMHARQQSASPEAFDDTILHTQAVADAMVAQRVSDEDSLCQQVPADTSPPNQNLTGGPAIPPSPGGHLSRHAGVASGDAIDVGQPQHTTTRTGSKHVHVTSKSHGASFQDVYSSDIFIVQAQARSPDDALSTARALLCARCAHSTGRPALATAELQMHLDWYGKPVVDAELAGATMGSWPVAEGADDEGLSKEERVSAWLSSDAAGSVSGHGEVVLHGVQDTGHGFRASRGRSETGDLSLSMYGVSSPLDAAKCLGVEDAAGGAEIGDAWRKGNTRGRVGATEASGEVTGSQMEVEGAQREESAGGEARVVDTSREETVGGKSEVGGERPGESAGGRAEVGKISSAAHVSDRAARSGAPGDEEGAGKIGGAAVKGAGTNAATWSEAEWAFGDVRQSDTPQLQGAKSIPPGTTDVFSFSMSCSDDLLSFPFEHITVSWLALQGVWHNFDRRQRIEGCQI